MWKPRINLKFKAMATVLGVIVAAVSIVVLLDLDRATAALRNAEEHTAQGLASSVSTACELPMAVGDVVELERLANRYMDIDADLAFIALLDEEGTVRAKSIRDPEAWSAYEHGCRGDDCEEDARNGHDHSFLLRRTPISSLNAFDPDDHEPASTSASSGEVLVGVSLDGFNSVIAQQRAVAMFTLGLAVLLSAVIVLPIVGRWTRRLEALVSASEFISKGDFSHEIRDNRDDEIGTLVRSFERMRAAIDERDRFERQQREELEIAKRDAEKANNAKSQFLAHMSHEIRTPLNGVVGMLDLVRDTDLSEKQQRYIDIGRASAEALLGVINDILDFSKIEAGQLSLEAIDFDLHEIVESVMEMLAPKGQAKGLEMVCSIAPDVPRYTRGDPSRLRQILLNLLSNAIKFTEEGEVVLRLELEDGIDQEDVRVRVRVEDTGIGIPEEARAKLFKSFSQVDGSTTRRFGGTGLGLAISKSLAEMMGGRIGLAEDRDVGSEFWFTAQLDLAEPPQSAPAPDDLKPANVLVIDDNATNTEILVEALTNWGMRHEAVGDGLEGLRTLRKAEKQGEPFEIILLDMQMPEMDGVVFADAVQNATDLGDYTIIMLSSMCDHIDTSDLHNHGIDEYLSKPVRLSLLYETIARLQSPDASVVTPPEDTKLGEQDRGALKGLRLLVAEDNSVNQIVITELLTSYGIESIVVETGKDAVDTWANGGFDAILMDCEMPVMDGFKATRTIRERETKLGIENEKDDRRTPIIALTAKAIQGDRELCLDAGMDDYLCKPLDPNALLDSLLRHTKRSEFTTDGEPNTPGQTEENGTASAGEGGGESRALKIDEALVRCGGSRKVLVKVLDAYVNTAEETVDKLETFVNNEELPELSLAAHSLKGASANVGADGAQRLASDVERLAKEAAYGELPGAVNKLRIEIKRVLYAIEQYRDASGEGKQHAA